METRSEYVPPGSYAPPEEGRPGLIRRTAWGAIFGGSFVAIMSYICLTLLGVGIGLKVAPASDGAVGIGAAIWMVAVMIVSLFIGGLIVGKLANLQPSDGVLHGLILWGLVTFTTMVLLTSATGQALGTASNVLTQSDNANRPMARQGRQTDTAGSRSGASPQAQASQAIRRDAAALLNEAATQETRQQMQQAQAQRGQTGISDYDEAVDEFVADLEAGERPDADAMTEAITEHSALSRRQAQQKVQQWTQQYGQEAGGPSDVFGYAAPTGRQLREMSETAGNVALWTCVALILSALAAALGGWLGTPAGQRTGRVQYAGSARGEQTYHTEYRGPSGTQSHGGAPPSAAAGTPPPPPSPRGSNPGPDVRP